MLYDLVKFLSWMILRIGFGLEVRGREHIPSARPFILAANHVSFLDPLVVGVACPRRLSFMVRASLYRYRLLRWFFHGTRCIPIDREGGDVGAIRAAVRRLREGRPIAIFPEGTRQLSGRLGQAKRGVAVVATGGRVPIIPALVRGTCEALPPGSRRLHPAKIQVAFGPQIPYTTSPSATEATGRLQAGGAARYQAIAEAVTQSWRRLDEQLQTPSLVHHT